MHEKKLLGFSAQPATVAEKRWRHLVLIDCNYTCTSQPSLPPPTEQSLWFMYIFSILALSVSSQYETMGSTQWSDPVWERRLYTDQGPTPHPYGTFWQSY